MVLLPEINVHEVRLLICQYLTLNNNNELDVINMLDYKNIIIPRILKNELKEYYDQTKYHRYLEIISSTPSYQRFMIAVDNRLYNVAIHDYSLAQIKWTELHNKKDITIRDVESKFSTFLDLAIEHYDAKLSQQISSFCIPQIMPSKGFDQWAKIGDTTQIMIILDLITNQKHQNKTWVNQFYSIVGIVADRKIYDLADTILDSYKLQANKEFAQLNLSLRDIRYIDNYAEYSCIKSDTGKWPDKLPQKLIEEFESSETSRMRAPIALRQFAGKNSSRQILVEEYITKYL